MNDVELRGVEPREHSFLAMPAQINVGRDVIRIPQMIDEADERIDHVVLAAFLVSIFTGDLRIAVHDARDRFAPLVHYAVEVPLDQVGGLIANLDAVGGAAPNRRTP